MGLADVITARTVQTAPGERPMSLPAAMNALQRGEIVLAPEVGGELGKLLPPSPSLPKAKPRPDPLAPITAEQRAQDAAG